MSRRRYAVTQCVTVLVALLAVAVVIIVTFSNNDVLNDLILHALNSTRFSFSSKPDTATAATAAAAAAETPPSPETASNETYALDF
jgi:hypothetical protein